MSESHAAHEEHGLAHPMPISTLLSVFVALVVLTLLTYTASNVVSQNEWLSPFGVAIAMFIATIKALLVVLYFMHLRHDKALNNLIFFFCFAFFFLFIAFVLIDSLQYQPEITAFRAAQATN